MTTVAAYIRVSSKGQDHAMQRDAIERAAKARGQEIRYWFAEKQSAKTMDRPELEQLRRMAAHGGISTLYVFRIDRLSRTGIRDTLAAVQEFKGAGVKVVTVADNFDLEGMHWEIILAVMAWAAQMERLATNERISAARTAMEARGESWGRPERMTAEQIARAMRMKDSGLSIRAICGALKVPRSTLAKTLARTSSHRTPPELVSLRELDELRQLSRKDGPKTAPSSRAKSATRRTRGGAVPKAY